ncbi:glycoside hydrolase family 32 protein [Paenibacillus sp. WLX2291]|uniref:glycoside hydrolase family 32 protein n=1 Tax=Paenibacillus sp. WLX2291 TaxID=3296934 RepID=UPI003983F0E7
MSLQIQHDYRGAYHFSPARGWMNDPNGMVYLDGEYHLFFQYHPFGETWGPMHWGHAVSDNLVHWRELPIALAPDELGTIFSGSAVVDWHNTTGFFPEQPGLVAIFTHHDEQPGQMVRQSQSLAYSHDRGRTWQKYAGNPVLTCETRPDFRDPKVFRYEPDNSWIMIVTCGQTVALYRSFNLLQWSELSVFGEGIGSHDGVWECPDIFPLPVHNGEPDEQRWIMLVSIGDAGTSAEGSRTQYFIGQFDGTHFIPDEASQQVRWLDHGRDNYAGVSWSDIPAADGRRLYIGWMSNWRYANTTPTGSWRGAMTIARELLLEKGVDGSLQLLQIPVSELEQCRHSLLQLEQATLEQVRTALAPLRLRSYELHVVLSTTASVEWEVLSDGQHRTVIGVDAVAGTLYIDRTVSGDEVFHDHFAGRHEAVLSANEAALSAHVQVRELRIFVDRGSVEVFADGGRAVMTDLVFPTAGAERLGLMSCSDEQNEKPRISVAVYDVSTSRQA